MCVGLCVCVSVYACRLFVCVSTILCEYARTSVRAPAYVRVRARVRARVCACVSLGVGVQIGVGYS